MSKMTSQLDIYQQMSALSARMVEAAQAQDWDSLIQLERSVVALRRSLATDEDNRLSASELERKRGLIQRILDDDAEIRRHTEPWMERILHFITDTRRSKKARKNACSAAS